jgi:hypothetical protein
LARPVFRYWAKQMAISSAFAKVRQPGQHGDVYSEPAIVSVDLAARPSTQALEHALSRLYPRTDNISIRERANEPNLAFALRALLEGQPFEPVPVHAALHLCIGHSGRASSRLSVSDAFALFRVRHPKVGAQLFERVDTLLTSARFAIEVGDLVALGRLMDLNQILLRPLDVSTPQIEQMCAIARRAGALGAKLTRVGGGRSVVAVVPSRAAGEAVIRAWKARGFDGFAISTAAQGRARPAPNWPVTMGLRSSAVFWTG